MANACWAVVPGMIEHRAGTIVTISSELALAGGDGDAHYAAAKGAILGFTRSLGAELAPTGRQGERGGARTDRHPAARGRLAVA